MNDPRSLADHTLQLCQALIRIDTTNPPGHERAAADLVARELTAAGLEPVVLEGAPGRTNVVARLRGTGDAPPLLLASHLDVVEADASQWKHPPFSGDIADGCLWGRGAIDMKNMVAMSVALVSRLAREGRRPKRDIILAAVADEEAACTWGSAWLCANHPELVRAEYAMGEAGGFNMYLPGRTVFTVQVAEKGIAWLRARATGSPGHGSMPRDDSAVVKLARAVAKLGGTRLPLHATDAMRAFVQGVAGGRVLPRVLGPRVLSRLAGALDPSSARGLRASLSNTVSPTILRAGHKINVIPGVAEADLDGRTLPGQTTADLIREIQAVVGPDVTFEVLHEAPPISTGTDSPLYDTIASVLRAREPEALVVPYLVPGFTDAKYFTSLGARWYGFSPVKFPRGMRFADLYHGHDERIPLDGLAWGTDVLADVVQRFTGLAG